MVVTVLPPLSDEDARNSYSVPSLTLYEYTLVYFISNSNRMAVLLLLILDVAFGHVQLPGWFSDGMVLQTSGTRFCSIVAKKTVPFSLSSESGSIV